MMDKPESPITDDLLIALSCHYLVMILSYLVFRILCYVMSIFKTMNACNGVVEWPADDSWLIAGNV